METQNATSWFRGYERYVPVGRENDYEANPAIVIGLYYQDGSTAGEFTVEWVTLFSSGVCPKLTAFDDSWRALQEFKDLLEVMASLNDKGVQEQEFCGILDSLGIKDISK